MEIATLHGIVIRTWQSADIPSYANLIGDAKTMCYISSGATRTHTQARNEIAQFDREQQQQGWSRWAVSLAPDGPFIGYAGFAQKPLGINFGMRFLKDYWGTLSPFTTAQLALTHGFETLGFTHVHTLTNTKHRAALNMNKRFLQLNKLPDTIIETPFGPHLKIDITREYFRSITSHNASRLQSAYRRLSTSVFARLQAHQPSESADA